MKRLKFLLLLLPLAFACNPLTVDESYDFIEKGVNTEMTILPGFTAAVDVNLDTTITIGDLIKPDDGGLIKVDAGGDYSILLQLAKKDFNSGTINMALPSFSKNTNFHLMDISVPKNEYGLDYSDVLNTAGLTPVQNLPFSDNYDIDLSSSGFPAEVTKISSAVVTGNAKLVFTLEDKVHTLPNEVSLYLKGSSTPSQATRITFPSWLKFGSFSYEGMKLENNVLSCTKNINLKNGLEVSIPLVGIEVPEEQGVTSSGNFTLTGQLDIQGELVLDLSGYNGAQALDYKAGFDVNLSTVNLGITSATVEVDIDPDFGEIPSFQLEGLPEILTSEETKLDFHDLWLLLDVEHNFPAAFTMGAKIAPVDKNYVATRAPYAFRLSIPEGKKSICISEQQVSGYYQNVQIPELSDMFMPIPELIKITDLDLGLAEGPVTIQNNSSYSASVEFSLASPLALGEKAKLSFNQSMDVDVNLGDDISVEIDKATIKFDLKVKNSLPLDVDIVLSPSDANGNAPFDPITKSIAAGTIASPAEATEPVEVSLPLEKIKTLKSFDVSLTAAAKTKPGVTFNKDMGVSVSIGKISLIADSGITVDLGNNKDNDK